MKKYDYVKDLSWGKYKAWEGRMIHWTEFLSMWNTIALQYMRDYLGLTRWFQELHDLDGLNDYG